jgi:hypothetical protein
VTVFAAAVVVDVVVVVVFVVVVVVVVSKFAFIRSIESSVRRMKQELASSRLIIISRAER